MGRIAEFLRRLFGLRRPALVSGSQPTVQVDHPPIKVTPWLSKLPARVLFVDVETTGLNDDDRVVSFAGILLTTAALAVGEFHMKVCHLVFDPGRKSHRKAEDLHGYDDWTLRHQDFFVELVDVVVELIAGADLVVAHNASFDRKFIDRELVAVRRPCIAKPFYCTMEAHRAKHLMGSSSLDTVAADYGFSRAGLRHGALEDAWLAMMIYLGQQGCPRKFPFERLPDHLPRNLRPAPQRPEGRLPRRKRRHAPLGGE
jgi:DNA polymerase III subunit epsilon